MCPLRNGRAQHDYPKLISECAHCKCLPSDGLALAGTAWPSAWQPCESQELAFTVSLSFWGLELLGRCHQALSWSSATESILSSSHFCPKARWQGGQDRQLRATWLSVYLPTTFGSSESHAVSSQHVEIINAGRGGGLTALNSSLHTVHM